MSTPAWVTIYRKIMENNKRGTIDELAVRKMLVTGHSELVLWKLEQGEIGQMEAVRKHVKFIIKVGSQEPEASEPNETPAL
jgi:predicted secreted acid phosphatase